VLHPHVHNQHLRPAQQHTPKVEATVSTLVAGWRHRRTSASSQTGSKWYRQQLVAHEVCKTAARNQMTTTATKCANAHTALGLPTLYLSPYFSWMACCSASADAL
jgi:hypothetical protein